MRLCLKWLCHLACLYTFYILCLASDDSDNSYFFSEGDHKSPHFPNITVKFFNDGEALNGDLFKNDESTTIPKLNEDASDGLSKLLSNFSKESAAVNLTTNQIQTLYNGTFQNISKVRSDNTSVQATNETSPLKGVLQNNTQTKLNTYKNQTWSLNGTLEDFFRNTTRHLSTNNSITAQPSFRDFIVRNTSSQNKNNDSRAPPSSLFSNESNQSLLSNESNQEKSTVDWNNEPIISDPVPIRNFVPDSSPPLFSLPLDDLLSEKTIKPLSIELTRYKNESDLVLNKTIASNNISVSKTNQVFPMSGISNNNNNNISSQELQTNSPFVPVIGPDVLAALSTNLQQDVLDLWPYRDYIKGPEDLMLDQGLINRAKLNTGSGRRLKRLFERGVKGENIQAALISSSVSRAFLKDPTSKRWLYPNALVNWWAKVVSPITRSQMILQDVSISGVGSDYFSRCLKSHLKDNGENDLILWELSGSDYKPEGVLKNTDAEAFEHFLRNVLEYKSSPEVVLLNFFRGNHSNKTAYCRELDEAKEERLARYYDCTALSWSKSICPYLKDDDEGFSYSYLFSRDQTHPSIIGHAQMAYILIDYLRDEFLKFLEEHKSAQYFSRSIIMPLPKSLYAQDYNTLCYSTLKAVDDPPDAETSSLPVIFIAPEPFEDAAHRSNIAKYIYKPTMKKMIMRITIPGPKTALLRRTISVMPYFNAPARTMVRIDNQPFTELKVNNYNRGKILKISPSMLLSGGDHMLRIWSLDRQFKLLALTVDS